MKDQAKTKNGMIEGVIWQQLFLFFIPIFIGTFFQQLYNTVDSVIVGQFAGKEALSSVGGSSSQIINLIVGFFTGLSSGCSVVIAQFFGAGEERGLHRSLHTAYAFSLTGGIGFGLMGILGTPFMLRLLNTPEALLASSTLYMRVYFCGLLFVFVYNMGSAVLRATGDSKRPLFYLMVCCVVNIILDLTFVLALRLSVFGVALATLISQGLSAAMVTLHFIRQTGPLKLTPAKIRFYPETLKKMLLLGLPSGFQSTMYSVSNMTVQRALNGFGVDTMAAWTALGKIDSFFWMINNAMGVTTVTFIGQNYGAGRRDRIRRGCFTALVMEFCLGGALSLLILGFGGYMYRIFTGDPAVIAIGMEMIRVISPLYAAFAFIEIFSATLRAQGHVFGPTVIIMVGVCLLRIVWVTFFAAGKAVADVVFCYPLTWIVTGIIMTLYYFPMQRRINRQVS